MLVGLYFGDGGVSVFSEIFLITGSIGLSGALATRRYSIPLRSRDGFLVAVLFWVILSSVSAIPFLLMDGLRMSFTDAVFEAVSGVTTTGASVLSGLDSLPRSILYYRAQLNFLGGLGVIVLAIAILPILGIGGATLYLAEAPGAVKDERLTPRLADTAKHLWFIYVGLAVACILAYKWAGMGWFDALCHSLSTVSLGGFSPHDASLGFYQNVGVEIAGGVFSILAGVNFALYFKVIQHRSLKPLTTDPEFRFFIRTVAVVVAVVWIYLYISDTFPLEDALSHGFFQAISVMTDNGLGAGGYPAWPVPVALFMILTSFFGGCVGSTCGGIKAMRFLLLYRQSIREIKQLIHPHAIIPVKLGDRVVPSQVIQAVWGFFFLYVFSTCFLGLSLVFTGVDPVTAFGTIAACINNMGIGFGATGGGFGVLNDTAKWLMCLAMLIGRLEVFPILIIFSRTFWRF